MDGGHILTGGNGFRYADWYLASVNPSDGPGGFWSEQLNHRDGVTELCHPAQTGGYIFPDIGGDTGSFYMPYNTPFQSDFNGFLEAASVGSGESGPIGMVFTLTNPDPVPTPEPTSCRLVGLGVLAPSSGVAMCRFAAT